MSSNKNEKIVLDNGLVRVVFRNVPPGKYGLVINGEYAGEFESNNLKKEINFEIKRQVMRRKHQ